MTIYQQSLGLAVLLLLGLLGGRLAKKIKMPMVVGYVLTGLILSPSILNVIPVQLNKELEIIKILGLGMIALMIGGELELKRLRKIASSVVWITVVQIFGASVVVFVAMYYILNLPLPISLLLGAMATATAPASPVAVIREYKAKGPFTSTLLGVVALDDALCIILFGIVAAFVGILLKGGSLGLFAITEPLLEVFGSVGLGALTGVILIIVLRFINARNQTVVVLLGFALLNSGLAYIIHLSPLLINMVTGFVIANFYAKPDVFQYFEDIEMPIYVVFFTLAGASLHIDVLAANWLPAAVYILARGMGKVGGVFLGARLANAEQKVQKYLGFAMFSKAGVTIGLLLLVQGRFPEIAIMITAIELAAVTVCEIVGPMGTRYALISSGETDVSPKKTKITEHQHFNNFKLLKLLNYKRQ
ncbi:MAG: cation:proton antiporter [Bacillota bacterium]|nr:cation:proton antiporter [Bacillota bacterium]